VTMMRSTGFNCRDPDRRRIGMSGKPLCVR